MSTGHAGNDARRMQLAAPCSGGTRRNLGARRLHSSVAADRHARCVAGRADGRLGDAEHDVPGCRQAAARESVVTTACSGLNAGSTDTAVNEHVVRTIGSTMRSVIFAMSPARSHSVGFVMLDRSGPAGCVVDGSAEHRVPDVRDEDVSASGISDRSPAQPASDTPCAARAEI